MFINFIKLNNQITNQRGYIALMSAVVISALLIGLTFILSFTGFFARFNILDAEYKKISLGLAEACADSAVLKLAIDSTYNPVNEINDVAGRNCTIISVNLISGTQYRIRTQGMFQKSYSNIEVLATRSPTNINIDSWQEIP